MMAKRTYRIRSLVIMLQLTLAALGATAASAGAQPPMAAKNGEAPTLAPLIRKVAPAVVNISVTGHVAVAQNPLLNDPFFRRFFDLPQGTPQEREFHSAGSGVIVDAQRGYVLTNNHVVDRSDKVTVTLADDREFEAEVIGTDPEVDLALLKIPAERLSALPMGDSDGLEVGDYVVAVGNPFGLGQTVTSGIVSAVGRSGLGIEGYEDFIQTDASINPGNSGGALVDLQGELVGINTAIIGPAGGNVGIGFAIPSNMAWAIMDQIIKHGEVRRGMLGVVVQDLTPDVAEAMKIDARHGALVAQVEPGSPAERAGLEASDVIVRVNGNDVRSASDLRNTIGLMDPNHEVRLEIIRDRKPRTVTARLAPKNELRLSGGQIDQRFAGVEFGSSEAGTKHPAGGVEVRRIDSSSQAYAAGLREGDVIMSVNQRRVSSLDEFQGAVRMAGGPLLLGIVRGTAELLVVIR